MTGYVYHRERSDVLHAAAVDYKAEVAVTACGQSVDFGDTRLIEGEWTEGHLHWLRGNGHPRLTAICGHCGNRRPPWERET